MRICHWVKDDGVPGGKFLVPGCFNRAVYGDHANCHCPRGFRPGNPDMDDLLRRIEALEKALERRDEH